MIKIKNLFILVFMFALAAVTACGGNDAEETEQQKSTRLLSKTWVVSNYVNSGETTAVSGVTIKFNSDNTFTVTDPSSTLPNTRTPEDFPLPASGTWSFASATNLNTITLKPTSGGEVTLKNVAISDNALAFDYDAILVKPAEAPVTVTVNAVPQ